MEVTVGKILCIGTYATDDPTRATMPFIAAAGALERGHKPMIVLMGEAVYLLKKGIADSVHGVGFPPLQEFVDNMIGQDVPFYL